jgi:hypothetical protein
LIFLFKEFEMAKKPVRKVVKKVKPKTAKKLAPQKKAAVKKTVKKEVKKSKKSKAAVPMTTVLPSILVGLLIMVSVFDATPKAAPQSLTFNVTLTVQQNETLVTPDRINAIVGQMLIQRKEIEAGCTFMVTAVSLFRPTEPGQGFGQVGLDFYRKFEDKAEGAV